MTIIRYQIYYRLRTVMRCQHLTVANLHFMVGVMHLRLLLIAFHLKSAIVVFKIFKIMLFCIVHLETIWSQRASGSEYVSSAPMITELLRHELFVQRFKSHNRACIHLWWHTTHTPTVKCFRGLFCSDHGGIVHNLYVHCLLTLDNVHAVLLGPCDDFISVTYNTETEAIVTLLDTTDMLHNSSKYLRMNSYADGSAWDVPHSLATSHTPAVCGRHMLKPCQRRNQTEQQVPSSIFDGNNAESSWVVPQQLMVSESCPFWSNKPHPVSPRLTAVHRIIYSHSQFCERWLRTNTASYKHDT